MVPLMTLLMTPLITYYEQGYEWTYKQGHNWVTGNICSQKFRSDPAHGPAYERVLLETQLWMKTSSYRNTTGFALPLIMTILTLDISTGNVRIWIDTKMICGSI